MHSKIVLALLVSSPAFAQQTAAEAGKPIGVTDQASADQSHVPGAVAKVDRPRLVLPLDHGPRATTTPWANQQRRLRAEEKNKELLAKDQLTGPSAVGEK